MNKKDDIYVMKTVMNETEDICETKTIINFLMKYIVTVTRLLSPSSHTGPPAACQQILGRPRWPRWWSSWITFEGRTERWGSVTVWARKGLHQYVLVRTGLDHSHVVCGWLKTVCAQKVSVLLGTYSTSISISISTSISTSTSTSISTSISISINAKY